MIGSLSLELENVLVMLVWGNISGYELKSVLLTFSLGNIFEYAVVK